MSKKFFIHLTFLAQPKPFTRACCPEIAYRESTGELFDWMSKVISECFSFPKLRYVIGLGNSHHYYDQKLYDLVTWVFRPVPSIYVELLVVRWDISICSLWPRSLFRFLLKSTKSKGRHIAWINSSLTHSKFGDFSDSDVHRVLVNYCNNKTPLNSLEMKTKKSSVKACSSTPSLCEKICTE